MTNDDPSRMLHDEEAEPDTLSAEENAGRAIALFRYISELSRVKTKSVLNLRDYRWCLFPGEISQGSGFTETSWRDRSSAAEEGDAAPLLTIRKPQFAPCPEPAPELLEWISSDWTDCRVTVTTLESIRRPYIVHPERLPAESGEGEEPAAESLPGQPAENSRKGEELPDSEDLSDRGQFREVLGYEDENKVWHPIVPEGNLPAEADSTGKQDAEADESDHSPEANLTDSHSGEPEDPDPEDIIPEECYREAFGDDAERVENFRLWLAARDAWAARHITLEEINSMFAALYQICVDLEQNSETLEMVAANGILRDKRDSRINHPVLTRRVKVEYDPLGNCLNILDSEVPSELYTVLFQEMSDINLNALNQRQEELREEDYHPFDRESLPDYLTALVHQLSPRSCYIASGNPEDVPRQDRLYILNKPCFFIRSRLDGTVKMIEQIIANIQENGYVPDHLTDIISGGKIDISEDTSEPSLEELLASVSGESSEILLAKEANREQLEIAKRIGSYNAVLVQGPPGTGKTHTIANLLGHFLAHGQSVLVTSQTTKALRVLKDKVEPELQDLCVSLLDDSNQDMERSIDGIITHMAQTTSFEVKKEMEKLRIRREELIARLGEARKEIYRVLESEHTPIQIGEERLSPAEAAAFVTENREALSWLPGYVRPCETMPLTLEQLIRLYATNDDLTAEEERELQYPLPNTETLTDPEVFAADCGRLEAARQRISSICAENQLVLEETPDETQITIVGEFGILTLSDPMEENLKALSDFCRGITDVKRWMLDAAVDGKRGSKYTDRWNKLIDLIEAACSYAEKYVQELFEHSIVIPETMDSANLPDTIMAIRKQFLQSGKVSALSVFMNRDIASVMKSVTIDGRPLRSSADCETVLHCLQLKDMRSECARLWDKLFREDSEPSFFDLDEEEPERVAANRIDMIRRYLDWYTEDHQRLTELMNRVGITDDRIYAFEELDSDRTKLEKTLRCARNLIPVLCDLCRDVILIRHLERQMSEQRTLCLIDDRTGSGCCCDLADAIDSRDPLSYCDSYERLKNVQLKSRIVAERSHLLQMLSAYAPQWAEDIRNRKGIHGENSIPENVENAWKWKQCEVHVHELLKVPFARFQAEAVSLSSEYRRITAEYAAKSAWYHLLHETEADIDMKHALIGWKQTVKRIGKGTGKNAAMFRAKARELMSQCQRAVPVWIMPLQKAMESLDPRSNRFDVIIIDEASQSDISALAVLYTGRKLIIVGDDRQVSPAAVGIPVEQINALKQMYIDGRIPNAHLYDAKTSIYDVAATTFQPLMLREHFRCMPEIIQYSNELSYDNKILPLRDIGSSVIRPVLVNYPVKEGRRTGRTNPGEARAIVDLMKSCMTLPEYEGKTFGVISMLGDEQAKLIQRLILDEIEPLDITSRKILCSNAGGFQGDERDIIFLSLVDSNEGEGLMRIQNAGADDLMKKRYNVAVSRARDQLWVVHSFDLNKDLKEGDLRRQLIEFAMKKPEDPAADSNVDLDETESFENKVYQELVRRGYHMERPWKVADYTLDMAAISGTNKVIVECDGEDLNCQPSDIRSDLEGQIILERLGWHFIRVRGTDFFLDRGAAMQTICEKLALYHVFPAAEADENSSGEAQEHK